MPVIVPSGASREFTLTDAPEGLAGTLTVAINDGVGGVVQSPTPAGIAEVAPGVYGVTLTLPVQVGQYLIVWANGQVTAVEEVTVIARVIGFTTVEHVEAYAPARAPFTTQTKPSRAGVEQLIADATTQVRQAMVRGGYEGELPEEATEARAFVAAACAQCAAALVEEVAPTHNPNGGAARKLCDASLERMEEGELPGAPANDASSLGPRSGFDGQAHFSRDMRL